MAARKAMRPILRNTPPMGIYETLYAFQAAFGKPMGEAGTHPWRPDHDRMPVVEAPTGITYFAPDKPPGDMAWTETYFNRRLYRVHPSGGHFAPAEEPELLVEDIREMFRPARE